MLLHLDQVLRHSCRIIDSISELQAHNLARVVANIHLCEDMVCRQVLLNAQIGVTDYGHFGATEIDEIVRLEALRGHYAGFSILEQDPLKV